MTRLNIACILCLMTNVWQHSRSFVVQFSQATNLGNSQISGRAEHVATGKRIRFSSMEELVNFMTTVLEEVRRNFEEADTMIEEIPPQT